MNSFASGSSDELVARVASMKQEPGWIPGEKAGYHVATSWFALGEVVRVASGVSIDVWLDRLIASPLDAPMRLRLSIEEWDESESPLTPMWLTERLPPSDVWPGNDRQLSVVPRPGGGARGPIRSLAKVYESLLFDERLLDRATADLLRARHRSGMIDQTFGQHIDWGLGVMLDSKRHHNPPDGSHAYGFGPHATDTAFGHGGNQSSCAFADPAHRLVVAWVCNGMPGEPAHQSRAQAINKAIYEDAGLPADPGLSGAPSATN